MFTYLLNQRWWQWFEINNILSEVQFAYKPGYRTTDAFFVLRLVLDMNRNFIYLPFIDFNNAFDNVNRILLYGKLISHGISNKDMIIIESMYSKINNKVRTSKGLSETFLQQCGVTQGDSLSPLPLAKFDETYGFGKVWIYQGDDNQNLFLGALEKRCQDIYTQQCLSEIHDRNRCTKKLS